MRNRIEIYMKPLGLFQHILGKKIGISRISVNKIETGKVIPSFKIANDRANVLNVCIYQVFDLDGTSRYGNVSCNCVNNQNESC